VADLSRPLADLVQFGASWCRGGGTCSDLIGTLPFGPSADA
jgi:hypothetical protein